MHEESRVNGILTGTASGCWIFGDDGDRRVELAGRAVSALSAEPEGTCLAVVDGHEIMRRNMRGEWSSLAKTELDLVSLVRAGERILAGSMGDATLLSLNQGELTPVRGFAALQSPSRGSIGAMPGIETVEGRDP
jgi:hypothetical protein